MVVCVDGWLDLLRDLLARFNIKKSVEVVPGGETGQMSILMVYLSLRGKVQER